MAFEGGSFGNEKDVFGEIYDSLAGHGELRTLRVRGFLTLLKPAVSLRSTAGYRLGTLRVRGTLRALLASGGPRL